MESAEDKLIANFFRPLATHPGALSLTDDAAFFTPPDGHDLILTTDAIVGGIHVLADELPDMIARKALRVNLSDLAAKGAKPAVFLMSIALPRNLGEGWLSSFCRGLKEDSEAYHCQLAGGDTDRVPGPLMVTIFALGTLPRGSMVKRHGAQPGDHILVTGTIGDAALGLQLRRAPGLAERWKIDASERDHLLSRYRLPQPRVAFAETIRTYASAAIDVSDGFAGDLSKLLRVSGVTAQVALEAVPLSDAARKALAADHTLRETIYGGGDDYEIILTVPPARLESVLAVGKLAHVAIRDVGRVSKGHQPPRFLDSSGTAVTFSHSSFSHF